MFVWNGASSAMGEVSVRNSVFELRGIAGQVIYAGEGMNAFHQQLIYEDREAENIVVLGAVYGVETASLQLGGGVFGLADRASVNLSAGAVEYLERIGIYERYRPRFGDEHVGLVDVSDDVALPMAYLYGPGDVSGGREQMLVGEGGSDGAAAAGRVVLNDRLPGYPPHQESDRRAWPGGIEQKLFGPGDSYAAFFVRRNAGRIVNHQSELVLDTRGRRVIYLGGMVGIRSGQIDRAFAACGECLRLE